jgi:hypothetical protein
VRRNENGGMGRNGGSTEALRRHGDVAVAVEWCLGGGIWDEGLYGEGGGRGGGGNGEKGRNSDLKGSREEPKTHAIECTECVRSHSC